MQFHEKKWKGIVDWAADRILQPYVTAARRTFSILEY